MVFRSPSATEKPDSRHGNSNPMIVTAYWISIFDTKVGIIIWIVALCIMNQACSTSSNVEQHSLEMLATNFRTVICCVQFVQWFQEGWPFPIISRLNSLKNNKEKLRKISWMECKGHAHTIYPKTPWANLEPWWHSSRYHQCFSSYIWSITGCQKGNGWSHIGCFPQPTK